MSQRLKLNHSHAAALNFITDFIVSFGIGYQIADFADRSADKAMLITDLCMISKNKARPIAAVQHRFIDGDLLQNRRCNAALDINAAAA